MQLGTVRGIHVVVLMFAIMLLSVPLASAISAYIPEGAVGRSQVGRFLPHVLAIFLIVCIGPLRRAVIGRIAPRNALAQPADIAVSLGLLTLHAFAWMGAYVLWFHMLEGPTLLERRFGDVLTHDAALAEAITSEGMFFALVMAGLIGPVAEELVFRGLLFPLWQQRHGWIAAMLMSSTLFGIYHANFLPAFVGSIIYTCLYMRTRSLWAPIVVHAAYNVSTWYPLLGQFIVPRDLLAPGDPASWTFHIAALCALLVALPIYVWISRPTAVELDNVEDAHAALPR
jgi:uncharacterized protein